VRQLELQIAQARVQDAAPDVTVARVELERAQIALNETQDEYGKALDRPWEEQKVRDAWAKQLKQAELNYSLAQASLDRARNAQRAHTLGLDVLAAQLDEAKEQLARAVAAQRSYAVSLDMLAAEVEAARLSLQALQSWENPYLDQATAEEIAQAEARVRQAEFAVAKLELQMRDAELRTPFGGTVADVAVEVGDHVGPAGVAVMLATLDQLYARTVDLTELDVARVAVGQDVRVSVDALPDVALDGVLREVALRAGDYRGDVVYGVTVELRDAVAVSALRWGMTAVVQIQVE
jgi:multidrug resistance efflux pump